jgi:hypothetical protein
MVENGWETRKNAGMVNPLQLPLPTDFQSARQDKMLSASESSLPVSLWLQWLVAPSPVYWFNDPDTVYVRY